MESSESTNREQTISELRAEIVQSAIIDAVGKLDVGERRVIKAVVLYGSTARGDATEQSDIDIHFDPIEGHSISGPTMKKLISSIENILPDVLIQISSKPLILRGRALRHITSGKPSRPDKPASWKIVYAQSPEQQQELESWLQQEHERISSNPLLGG